MRFFPSKTILLSSFIVFIQSSCVPKGTLSTRMGFTNNHEVKPATEAAPPPSATPTGPLAFFFIPHPESNIENLKKILLEHPTVKLTLLIPPKFFNENSRSSSLPEFRVLQSSKQIEMALTLENEPILPLLADLKEAGNDVAKWGFTYAWPEDVAHQIARASAKYQKRWGELPSGIYPPYFSLSEKVVSTLKRFRLNWVLGHPDSLAGVRFFGATALFIPESQPVFDELKEGTRSWAKSMARWMLDQPFVLIDASQWEDPAAQDIFLTELVSEMTPAPRVFTLAREFSEQLRDEYALPENFNPFKNNFSAWISSGRQKKAWQAMSEAREVIESYKNSGKANIQRLDAAVEEMASVQDGPFLLGLKSQETSSESLERNFVATLANVYRLCGGSVPPSLSSLFSDKSWQKAVVKPSENDRPFFVEGAQSLLWNDPANDDNGGGSFVYPLGKYNKGSFDLRELVVSWDDTDVVFSVSLVASPNIGSSMVLPQADIHIDINKLMGAGSTTPMRKRLSCMINKNAAWEYALAISPYTTSLVQSVSGENPRLLRTMKTELAGNTLTARVSRQLLRGSPQSWRLSAAISGIENNRKTEDPTPVSVSNKANDKLFGGAAPGRTAPSYVDILVPTFEEQKKIFQTYESGAKITLPYVEVP